MAICLQKKGAPIHSCSPLPLPFQIRIHILLLLQCAFLPTSAYLSYYPKQKTPSIKRDFVKEVPEQQNPDIKAAVIVPGFLTGAKEYESLVQSLANRGIPAVVVPLENWHWLPCVSSGSMRPILERIDHTVRHLTSSHGACDVTSIPKFEYTMLDCLEDFTTENNADTIIDDDEYCSVDYPEAKGRIALIGHSAGGWISRIYLSNRNYAGRIYDGSHLVHSLVTLGSPHAEASGEAFDHIRWINEEKLPENVRALAVGGSGFRGDEHGQVTEDSYSFCCPHGSNGRKHDGDGITPLESALALKGAEKLVLEGEITHFPWTDVFGGQIFAPNLAKHQKENGTAWYGSDSALDQWVDFLI